MQYLMKLQIETEANNIKSEPIHKQNQQKPLQTKYIRNYQQYQKTTLMTTPNQNKPFTGNFQLETKIRVIIQQVLAATIRKLSVFNEKIDKFQDYFMVYKQKIEILQKGCTENKQTLTHQHEERMKTKKQITNNTIRAEQTQEKNSIRFDEMHNQITELTKTIKQIHRQNQNLNSQLSKTKGKFLEYSNVISGLKEQVSWKITKYIEQTANTNTEIKINNEQMKKEYFNVMLMLQKQKQKYEKIIELNENNENNTKRICQDIQRLQGQNNLRYDENKKTLQKMDEYDTILQAKLKTLQNKSELRFSQLQQDNKKSMNAVKKLQTFNDMIEKVKEQQQRSHLQILKKIEQTNKKTRDQTQVDSLKLSKELLKVEKTLDKKISQLKESTQKAEDFLTQKIEFIKMEIETEISSKTTALLQEKEDNNKVNSSTMEEVTTKINKINLQLKKQMVRLQGAMKEVKSQTKKQLQNFMETVQTKMDSIELQPRKHSDDESPGKKVSPELLKQIESFQTKITHINQKLQKKDQQIAQIHQNEGRTQILQKQMVSKIDTYFKDQQQDMSNKVQKIMFLVTKMRGDAIVRSEFIEKEIKEIKKNHSEYKQYTDTLLKLTPAIGECINLILALIYDAEYQHSKIIQDTLPLLKKDQEKFSTCVEGVLYEFKEKRKPGVICYRHKDLKKTQIVKATFNAHIKIWEELFEKQFKNKPEYLPKGFYKKAVQKAVNPKGLTDKPQQLQKRQTSLSPNKESNFYDKMANSTGFNKPFEQNNNRRNQTQREEKPNNGMNNLLLNQMASRQAAKSLRKIQEDQKIKEIKETIQSKQGIGSQTNMNSSFHIRKKKTLKKEQVIVVNITAPGQ